jgi:hypothetical protein
MIYELAKKLFDAGFDMSMTDHEMCVYQQAEQFTPGGMFYHIPTLSELVEACGDGFFSLSRHVNIWQTNWQDGMAGETAGNTPEEAVAELWLKLNKKV